MWRCSNCKELIEDTFADCWNCGTTIDGAIDPDFAHDFTDSHSKEEARSEVDEPDSRSEENPPDSHSPGDPPDAASQTDIDPPDVDATPSGRNKLRLTSIALSVTAGLWIACLLALPTLTTAQVSFFVTGGLILVNFGYSLWRLFRQGQVLILVNLMQLPLFCLLNYQLSSAFSSDHYRYDTPPVAGDWIELTAVHALRAVDILDGLEAYGIDLQNLEHNSKAAGWLLVCMHIAVDIFLIGLIFRVVTGRLKKAGGKVKPEWWLAIEADVLRFSQFIALAALALLIVDRGLTLKWSAGDWFWWPLDNILRAADFGDMFQIFDWRLHNVSMGTLTATVAIFVRLAAAFYLAKWLNHWRIRYLGGAGWTIDELIESVGDVGGGPPGAGDIKAFARGEATRNRAIKALRRLGPAAIPALIRQLQSNDGRAQSRAAFILRQFGSAAEPARPALIRVLTIGNHDAASSAADAVRQIGPATAADTPALIKVLQSGQNPAKMYAADAVRQIGSAAAPAAPALTKLLETRASNSSVVNDVLNALASIGPAAEPAVPALIELLTADGDYARGAITALGRIGPAAKPAVPAIREFLTCEDEITRYRAANALRRIEPNNK